jgi:GNAT superfamily N-acetyltransferase
MLSPFLRKTIMQMSRMDIVIRQARAEDLDTIVRFNRAMALETEDKVLDTATVTSGVRRALADPGKGRYLLAVIDGRVVGQLMFTLEWSDWRDGWLWWIQSVFVDPEWRGHGVFSRLYRHLAKTAAESKDVRGLRLYVESGNDRAQRVYRALGMRPAGYEVMQMLLTTGDNPDA